MPVLEFDVATVRQYKLQKLGIDLQFFQHLFDAGVCGEFEAYPVADMILGKKVFQSPVQNAVYQRHAEYRNCEFGQLGPDSGPNRSVADDHEFLAGQAFQTHGATHMQLVRADADLRPQTVFIAVGELG